MAIDAETRKPRIANVTAGLSGPAIKPIALRMVYDAAKSVKIPVIGMGGISTAVDIIEIHAGGSNRGADWNGQLLGSGGDEKIVGELERWCMEHRVQRVAGAYGRNGNGVDPQHTAATPPESLPSRDNTPVGSRC